MARRYRKGLAAYRARTATNATFAKRRGGPARTRARLMPGPTTKAAQRLWQTALGPISSWPAEARALKDAALADALGRPGYEGSSELWNEYLDANYRRRHREQQAARPKRAAKPSAWIRVRAHKRHRPGGSP